MVKVTNVEIYFYGQNQILSYADLKSYKSKLVINIIYLSNKDFINSKGIFDVLSIKKNTNIKVKVKLK